MISNVTIKPLHKDELDGATDIILQAFKDEAFTSSWLDLTDEKIRRAHGVAVKLKQRINVLVRHPAFAAWEGERLLGLVVLNDPERKTSFWQAAKIIIPNITRLLPLVPRFLRAIRRGLAKALKPPENLPEKYITLEAIAVAPAYQGNKIGRLLLEYAHNYCLTEQQFNGIYLVTGDEKNKLIYQGMGYQLMEKRKTGGFISYHMFLPAVRP